MLWGKSPPPTCGGGAGGEDLPSLLSSVGGGVRKVSRKRCRHPYAARSRFEQEIVINAARLPPTLVDPASRVPRPTLRVAPGRRSGGDRKGQEMSGSDVMRLLRDRGGRSSIFQRKMRPRSGMQAPRRTVGRGRGIPFTGRSHCVAEPSPCASGAPLHCPIPALRGPSPRASGALPPHRGSDSGNVLY